MCLINQLLKNKLGGFVLFAMLFLALPKCYAQSEQPSNIQNDQIITSSIPIQNFHVINLSGKVFIKWTQTASETDCLLTIERSENGSEYVEIGSKKGFKSNFSLFYSFIDNNPKAFVTYYKIKYTASSGDVSYSQVKQIENVEIQTNPNNSLSTASLN